jgi:hypothetical protein
MSEKWSNERKASRGVERVKKKKRGKIEKRVPGRVERVITYFNKNVISLMFFLALPPILSIRWHTILQECSEKMYECSRFLVTF